MNKTQQWNEKKSQSCLKLFIGEMKESTFMITVEFRMIDDDRKEKPNKF